jgi:hypothetical protein
LKIPGHELTLIETAGFVKIDVPLMHPKATSNPLSEDRSVRLLGLRTSKAFQVLDHRRDVSEFRLASLGTLLMVKTGGGQVKPSRMLVIPTPDIEILDVAR